MHVVKCGDLQGTQLATYIRTFTVQAHRTLIRPHAFRFSRYVISFFSFFAIKNRRLDKRTELQSLGHYIYMETELDDAKKGWKASLTSEPLIDRSSGCFSFWYHMFGSV